ncbi:MAG: hypothetical protein JW995_06545 [Melioribacteraceae bacterium]|nr:hypothetical protein [Melioribacteraceae bacterium]
MKILILFFVSTSLFAQIILNVSDTTKTETPLHKLKPALSLYGIEHLYISSDFFTDFNSFPELNQWYTLSQYSKGELNFKVVQYNLLKNARQTLKWQENYSLGIFGKYLGYAMSAAAVGLAVKHVVKYKGKAFFKRK